MALINPHINFNGNAEEAFTFYKSVFGGDFAQIMRFKDLASEEIPVPENEANKIMVTPITFLDILIYLVQHEIIANSIVVRRYKRL